MLLGGAVVNGQMVLDQPLTLPEGAKVQVEVRQLSEAQAEWLRRLRNIATDCGVSLSGEALSREAIYD